MRTHRFGRKIKLPATIAIKHQIRIRMAQYEVKKAEAEARAEVFRGQSLQLFQLRFVGGDTGYEKASTKHARDDNQYY
jgi:hypothetical protein